MEDSEKIAKAIGQFRLALHGVFDPFDMYGMGAYIPQAEEGIIKLALRLHRRLNGEDILMDGKN